MKLNLKKVVKFAGVVTAATGIVALSSVIASGAAVTVVKEGIKAAKDAMKKVLDEKNGAELCDEETMKSEPAPASAPAPAAARKEVVIAEPVGEPEVVPD